ncbi:MAG: hypothetical protein D6738_01915, partial [Acidobacteria bacterium]
GWGIGLFEVARGYERRAFRLARHVERLTRSARALGIRVRLPPLDPIVERLFELNRRRNGAVRLTCTGGGRCFLTLGAIRRLPPGARTRGAVLRVADWRRDPRAPLAGHKTLNYYANMIDRQRAWAEGAVDSLILGLRGEVLEGTRSNVFAVFDGRIVTPSLALGILPGITRATVIELCRAAGLDVREQRLPLRRLLAADEVFVTSSLMEVVPVRRIAEQRLRAPGPVTRTVAGLYRTAVEQECRRA